VVAKDALPAEAEMVAAALWRADVSPVTPQRVAKERTPEAFKAAPLELRSRWLRLANAALTAAPKATEAPGLREAAQCVLDTFSKDEAQGYRSKDRQFAISVLGSALSATPQPIAVPDEYVIRRMIQGANRIKAMEAYEDGPLHCVIADGNMDDELIDEILSENSLSDIEREFALYLQRELSQAERYGAWAIAEGWMSGGQS